MTQMECCLQFHTWIPHFGKDGDQLKLKSQKQEQAGTLENSQDGWIDPGALSFEGTAGATGNDNTPQVSKELLQRPK